MILGFLVVLVFAVTALLCVRVRRAGLNRLELSPSVVLIAAMSLYVAAVPVSRMIFGSGESAWDAEFVWIHGEALASLLMGFALASARGLYRRGRVHAAPSSPWSRRSVSLALLLATQGLFYGYVLLESGFDGSRLLAAYGATGYQSDSVLPTLMAVLPIAATWAAAFGAIDDPAFPAPLRRLVAACTVLLAIVHTLRGNRNEVMILLLPIIAAMRFRRRLSVRTAVVALALAWIGLYSVGVIRNYGFGQIRYVNFSTASYDPLNGELGTMFSVFEKSERAGIGEQLYYGGSYVVDPVVNLAPRQIWPERPYTLAQSASVVYYGGSILSAGIGFSPVVEAMCNFGVAGVIPLFLIVGVVMAALEVRADRADPFWRGIYALMLPVAINFCRIDFATVVKIALLHAVALWVCIELTRRRTAAEAWR